MASAPDFNLEDTRGQMRTLAEQKGRVVVLIFANQATQEASGKAASGLGKQLLQHPNAAMMTIVGVPKMFKMMAKGVLKGAQDKALDGARKRFEKEGQTAPADLDQRVLILPDWDATVVKSYGFDTKAKEVHLAVVAPDGSLAGTFSNASGEEIAQIAGAKALALLN